jgi:hypothetical protein
MSLLDAFNEPCTRVDTADYGIDEPIMDGPYGNAADHAYGSRVTSRRVIYVNGRRWIRELTADGRQLITVYAAGDGGWYRTLAKYMG